MSTPLSSLAASPWKLTASALENNSLNNEDLERLLQFLLEVNDVLCKAFNPLEAALQRIVRFSSDEQYLRNAADELEAIQQREFYHVRLVCNRLHGLREHARKHVEKIVAGLPNAGEWWELFTKLDEREGYIEHAVRIEAADLANDLRSVKNETDLPKVKDKARDIMSNVSSAVRDMEAFHNLLYSETGSFGFRALTDLSKTSLRQNIAHHFHIEEVKFMGDVFSNITNSTVISKSKVERAFNRLQSDGETGSAKLLVEIGDRIADANNAAAGAVYSQMAEELAKPAHDKGIIKSCWDGLVAILPPLANLSAQVIKAFAI